VKSAFKSSEGFEGASKAEIIDRIQQLVPPGSPEPQDPEILAALPKFLGLKPLLSVAGFNFYKV